ncbi:methionyl-tRNA formyltransferase [Alienimonas chondri]|uniref:Methionyl-tRNA formyltransferase n=1 Tax=Alienimonas chondri TaxID=2681879 RepID=A0ABX1VGD1_9PLAN|nr:formyltransferase family protein [Alienimonas chondri]NNJ26940.1 Methionyl-tRNA formyltransferase [Alienimonas chondri]
MKKLTVFAMTKKGRAVITAIHLKYPGMIAAVIASRDSGMAEDCYEDIRDFCGRNAIAFLDRRDSYTIATDYSLAVSWRWIIRNESSSLVVFHDSLLPRYRGFNPLVTALINGDVKVGVTALFATDEYDRGDIIAQSETAIEYPITIAEAIDAIQANYVSLGLEIADALHREEPLAASPQSEDCVTYSLWRDEDDYFIDWSASAATIRRLVDAVGFPYRGAASVLDGKVVRLLKAEALEDVKIENRTPGKVIFIRDFKPVVVCGEGLLRIEEMIDDRGVAALPLPRFRMRFGGVAERLAAADTD